MRLLRRPQLAREKLCYLRQ